MWCTYFAGFKYSVEMSQYILITFLGIVTSKHWETKALNCTYRRTNLTFIGKTLIQKKVESLIAFFHSLSLIFILLRLMKSFWLSFSNISVTFISRLIIWIEVDLVNILHYAQVGNYWIIWFLSLSNAFFHSMS